MAKFSAECMAALQQMLVGTLAAEFGDDTRGLSIRVGLHSGAVTAGVLRGLKGRFQLFGDTVNTAARSVKRMEISTRNPNTCYTNILVLTV